jgi:hypothetical protein
MTNGTALGVRHRRRPDHTMSAVSPLVRVLHSYCNHESAAQSLKKIIAQAEEGDRPRRTTPPPERLSNSVTKKSARF